MPHFARKQMLEKFQDMVRRRVPIIGGGAGTGLSGGALPVHGGIVLHTSALNRILEIDRNNLMAGVIGMQQVIYIYFPPLPSFIMRTRTGRI